MEFLEYSIEIDGAEVERSVDKINSSLKEISRNFKKNEIVVEVSKRKYKLNNIKYNKEFIYIAYERKRKFNTKNGLFTMELEDNEKKIEVEATEKDLKNIAEKYNYYVCINRINSLMYTYNTSDPKIMNISVIKKFLKIDSINIKASIGLEGLEELVSVNKMIIEKTNIRQQELDLTGKNKDKPQMTVYNKIASVFKVDEVKIIGKRIDQRLFKNEINKIKEEIVTKNLKYRFMGVDKLGRPLHISDKNGVRRIKINEKEFSEYLLDFSKEEEIMKRIKKINDQIYSDLISFFEEE